MLKKQLLTALLILLGFYAVAQTKGIKVGGEFRNVAIPKILNGNQRSLNTAAFKDKLLIIDFWATSCAGCVAALPKMHALQKQFNQQIKIIPVTYESETLVASFWKQNKYTRNLTLPVAVEDTKLNALFPHEVIPHEIWIYKGKVIGITSEEYVDAANISKVLEGKIPSWVVKDDYYAFDGVKNHLFRSDEKQIDLGNTKMEYVATCGYLENSGANIAGPFGGMNIVRDSVFKTVRKYYINQSIFNIYLENWNRLVGIRSLVRPAMIMTANQIVWEVSNPEKYMFRTNFTPMIKAPYVQDWKRNHAICFESQYADTGQTDKELAKKVITDLNWLLGLNVRWEKRKEKVFVVYAAQAGNTLPTRKSGDKMQLTEFISHLNNQPENPYVFNETMKNPDPQLLVNIGSWKNFAAVKKNLLENGLDLKEEERAVDKLIFSENNGGLIVDVEMSKVIKAEIKAQENMPVPTVDEGLKFLLENKSKKNVVVRPSGLQYEVKKLGVGPKPKINDKVLVHYTGRFVNGKIFESSNEGGIPLIISLNDAIKGWTEVLQLMPVGSKWRVYLPSELAYGTGGGMNIPPGSTLVFDIELISIL